MDPSTSPTSIAPTRRTFVRGIAAAGASTAAAASLGKAGLLAPATAQARPHHAPNAFSDFRALAPSAADLFEVPDGYRADVLIGWGDPFADDDGATLRYGFNNDFLAYFPLRGDDEGLIFVNHEYPAPFFQHGTVDGARKTLEQVRIEQESVGNSIVHIKRGRDDVWQVVSPSPYNRRVTAHTTPLTFTGPLAANPAYPGIGTSAPGSLANCSGGITPWGTALSCEENYQDYGTTGGYGWVRPLLDTDDYVNGDGSTADRPAKFGWVCEHDPYDPSFTGAKHTALGRFRHENTAFRARPGKPFVLYMGDDRNDGAVYKFVSELPYRPGRRAENLRILTSGKLYVARWEPDGRRRFDAAGTLLTATEGTGWWREVTTDELVDTHVRIARSVGAAEWTAHYATNRPEDVEVGEDGSVWVALTNNSSVNDVHGSIRRFVEHRNDASAVGPDAPFEWEDYAAGGRHDGAGPGEEGFSSPDNLVFDKAGNLWIVTDISSGTLNDPTRPQAFHANNAVFMIPAGQEAGAATAYRFANMPVQSEGTGPYFTPDEQTLFVNVQHPGENSAGDPSSTASYTSYWPKGSKTTERNPTKPIPATVAITKVRRGSAPGSRFVPAPPAPPVDTTPPQLSLDVREQVSLDSFLHRGLTVRLRVDEPATLDVRLRATIRGGRRRSRSGWSRGERLIEVDTARARTDAAGGVIVTLRARGRSRLLLRLARRAGAQLDVQAADRAGNVTTAGARIALT